MNEVNMDIEWRTVQLFIEDEYEDGLKIAEVELDVESSRKIRCSCKEFSSFARCKHQKWVKAVLDENDGHFTVKVPTDVDEDDALVALTTPEAFRQFIIKHGKIEVI